MCTVGSHIFQFVLVKVCECLIRVFHDFQFSQGDCPFDIFMGVEAHDKNVESSLLGESQV